jgi:hypothetical protein
MNAWVLMISSARMTMISELDKQASLIGVTRQSIIKVWLSERIKTEKAELELRKG